MSVNSFNLAGAATADRDRSGVATAQKEAFN